VKVIFRNFDKNFWIPTLLLILPMALIVGGALGICKLSFVDSAITGCICLWVGAFVVKIFHVRNIYLLAMFTSFVMFGIIALIIWCGNLYTKYGIVDTSGNVIYDFRTCLYFSAVTFTTLGYGDFQPTEYIRILAAFEAFMGYLFLGALIATFIVVIRKQHERNQNTSKSNK
jgi:hypothetical protein